MKYTKSFIAKIAIEFGCQAIPDNWTGIDAVLPLIKKIREDGSIFIVKFDGERAQKGESDPYSVAIFGEHLGDVLIGTDASSLEEGLTYAIGKYAEVYWKVAGLN
jgi:hypothetical protein